MHGAIFATRVALVAQSQVYDKLGNALLNSGTSNVQLPASQVYDKLGNAILSAWYGEARVPAMQVYDKLGNPILRSYTTEAERRAPHTGGGADLTFAFTFNGEPFTFGGVPFTYGAAS